MTTDALPQLDSQYGTGLSRSNIERALFAAGKDLERRQPADLEVVEDFHTLGWIATSQLAELAEISGHDQVLDAERR
jgi:sarcosine/dimethylglycine N-methyltransferase